MKAIWKVILNIDSTKYKSWNMSFCKKKTMLSYCKNKSKIWETVQALTFLIFLDKTSKVTIKPITSEQKFKTIEFIHDIFDFLDAFFR
jgi:hypothetical protein